MAFVTIEINTEEEPIREEGIARLKALLESAGVTGWEPNEADLAVIVNSTVASMVPSVAQIAAVVPPAIFRKYGTELVKTAYNEGAAATVTTTWTLLEEGGKFPARTIEAGTQLTLGELAFYVQSNVTVLEGSSTASVVLVASERGAEYNGLTGTIELVDAVAWVKEVTIVGETTGGVDQESDEEYENRLAAALKLQAPRPITSSNFAEMTLDIPSSILPSGVAVGRATAIDGYSPETHILEGTVTSGSTTMSEVTTFVGVSPEKSGGAQSHPGTRLKGTNIPEGTTVVSVNEGAKTLVMSAKATGSPGKKAVEAIGSYENQRTVTVFVTNPEGKKLSAEAMAAIRTWLNEFRELNFVIYVQEASYNEVQITATVHCLPNYTEASVVAGVKVALESFLSPKTFGNPTAQETGASAWLNATQGYNLVRYNQLIGIIEAVPGVQYVPGGSAGLAIGLKEAPGSKVADLTLLGPAPLPETVSANIKVTAV